MITNIVLFVITRNNKVLKDIYSPLEIDDQWDQRAPSHEDKVEGGNTDGMSSVTPEVPVENPSGSGVAVAEKPTQDMSADSDVQPQPVVDAAVTESAADSTAPGMQTNNESYSNITNIGQMTVPASPESTSVEGVSTEPTTTEPTPVSMEEAPTESTGTETPEVESDDDAASMLNSQQHDVPASPFDAKGTENDTSESIEDADASSEVPTASVMAEKIYKPDDEPDQNHKAEEGPSEEDAVRSIVEEPPTDDELETAVTDADQMPVSPEPVSSETHAEELNADNKKTRAQETLNGMIESIDLELKKLADKLKEYQEKQAKVESDIERTQAEIDAKIAEKDDFEASVTALNVRPSASDTARDSGTDLEQAA